jgi:hypothetical protein
MFKTIVRKGDRPIVPFSYYTGNGRVLFEFRKFPHPESQLQGSMF